MRTKEIIKQKEEITAQRDEIETQRDEIEAQRDLVTIQKEHIEGIYKEVTDSINYAKRIQTSSLPNEKLLNEHFGDSFILFKPKDIVSGDFYWFEKVENQIVVTVADCTGHGVPRCIYEHVRNVAFKGNRLKRIYHPARCNSEQIT